MVDKNNGLEHDELSAEQNKEFVHQDKNLLEEVKDIEQKIRNSDYSTFKKTTYWHQQESGMETSNQEALINIMECLQRIEAKINNIADFLDK